MSDSTDLLQSALASVNELGARLQAALDALTGHNVDLEAHEDIRHAIEGIQNSENIYTNEQIDERIKEKLDEHAGRHFQAAHKGWSEWESTLNEKLTSINVKITDLETKLDDYVENGENTGPSSSLKEIIDGINAKYNPMITELSNMIAQAKEEGDDELVATYQQSLSATLEARNQEIIKATEDWVASQEGTPQGAQK